MQPAETTLQAADPIDESGAAGNAPGAEPDRDALAAHLNDARKHVEALAHDLRGAERELDELATARAQHQLLLAVCTSLEELSATGGAELFWGDRSAAQAGAQQVGRARSRIDEFQQYVEAIEDRRAAIIGRLTDQQRHADVLEDDLFEALEAEERRQHEWIVEREINELPARRSYMPWMRGGEEDKRFRKSLGVALLLCALFALVAPYIPLPELLSEPQIEVPERVVRLMMKTRPQPTPKREQALPQPQPKPIEQKVAKQAPQQPIVPDKQVKDEPAETPVDQGILAFREQLAGLQQDQVVTRLGAQAHIDNGAGATRVERKMLTTNAPGSSGGINLGALSRGIGGGSGERTSGMAGTQLARVTSQIGGIGKPGQDRPLSGDGVSLSRTDEEIQIVFDRHKASLYRLYNRELRKDPTLRGQMVLRLTIEPDGRVSMCQLQASDMNAPELATQVVERVKTIDFGAKAGVPAITILYPIDFLPAA